MSDKRIVVPDEMKAAVENGIRRREHYNHTHETNQPQLRESIRSVEDALLWLSENPVVPTVEEAQEIARSKAGFPFNAYEWVRWGASEWQRLMFLAQFCPTCGLRTDTNLGASVKK